MRGDFQLDKDMDGVVTAVLGGGQGARLWPLTRYRAKPAVPLAGKFRLIDIPISNSLHSGIERIYVLTQFNSASLHRHIAQTYRFDAFRTGFVNILSAEQTVDQRDWYQGTADAVRKNLRRLLHTDPTEVLILSGDQLYQMDLKRFLEQHRRSGADLTVAVTAVPRYDASSFGVMRIDDEGWIVQFAEKPTAEEEITQYVAPTGSLVTLGLEPVPDTCLASMGIYVFSPAVLETLLDGTSTTDFGREVVPQAIGDYRVSAFGYPGYWRDIGTIATFHEANLELAAPDPPFDLYSQTAPIYSHARFLPGTRIEDCAIHRSVIADGAILEAARIDTCVIGIRSRVGPGSVLQRTFMMGANRYEERIPTDRVPLGVGSDCHITNAIIDLDTRIGDGARLLNQEGIENADHELYSIRDGVIVVPSGTEIPPGMVI